MSSAPPDVVPASTGPGPDRRALHRERTAAVLERSALELFDRRGFDRTTVDDLASAAGVGRRTFFRYFDSKNDVVLGGLDQQLLRLRRTLAALPPGPALQGVGDALRTVNDYGPAELPVLLIRMRLLHTVPDLQAHAARRYRDWERVIAEHVGHRTGTDPEALYPTALAKAAIGIMQAVFAAWLRDPDRRLADLIATGFGQLERGFADVDG